MSEEEARKRREAEGKMVSEFKWKTPKDLKRK